MIKLLLDNETQHAGRTKKCSPSLSAVEPERLRGVVESETPLRNNGCIGLDGEESRVDTALCARVGECRLGDGLEENLID